jgi:hypothetical protein
MANKKVDKILGKRAKRPPTERELAYPYWAYWYATRVLKGRFPAGEEAIAKSAYWSCLYAEERLKGPFPLGEPAILPSEVVRPFYIEFLKKVLTNPDEYFAEWISSGKLKAEEVYGE